MITQEFIFEDHYKKLGFGIFSENTLKYIHENRFKPYIKIFFAPEGYELRTDFTHYKTTGPTLFFINTNQYLEVKKGKEDSFLIYYNRDFYCVQIHDKEVACDGLLFNNIFEIPKIELDDKEMNTIKTLFNNIYDELEGKESSREEMIRTYLKQIIIRATRNWKKQNIDNRNENITHNDIELFRNFSRLLEIHFREKHTVADYAELLHLAPKTLTHKFKSLNINSPNQFIINRILLEAKRLLFYTDKPVKEIAYDLGYEDPAYFNRLFTSKVGSTPTNFKKNYSVGK
ncbi:AraC family transcriptional regulator [Chryseobacterium sp.]|uniref:helix-turn-helix domain-containing protein n=1 Tax=Chryseobacterium sp. TaxID=1871047 RepID=UPI0025C2CB47|nr:AraC family transcriptional regulator [Chryseobacterium sp.]